MQNVNSQHSRQLDWNSFKSQNAQEMDKRAAQKLAQTHNSSKSRTAELPNASARNGGFCGALQRAPPPMPPGLARRLANKENYGIGKVKVMLRVSDTTHNDTEHPHFMAVDKKKRQVTLTDPSAASAVAASTSQERGPMVAAPKMFAFDSLFTAEDQQSDICASALSEVIPAVLEGSDGCLLTIGYPNSGQPKTMLGGVNPPTELGAIPCAISWLYKGINERRQKSGARFSVRVSALGVSATKPDSSSKDLLAAHATESDDSPGVYLRDDFLGGPTELRAPTAERAALFLDAALAGRPQGGLEPAMIFTLHVYQYSLSRKGGVAGGRSRLHLIDLGGCANRNGGLPLSGIGNILLAILSGQRHPPNKDHPLTPLLKDCLAPLTCHVAIMAHVMHTQSHTDALTTIQLASRIHRMRRRKHRFPMPSDKTGVGGMAAAGVNGGHQSTGSSAGSGADPSSSELSAATVIYMGPSDDATDGEHPPVYLPSLSSGDNRCVMSKALKGSGLEKQQQSPAKSSAASTLKKSAAQKVPQSPTINASSRAGSLKRGHVNSPTPAQHVQQQQQPQATAANTDQQQQQQFFSPVHSVKSLSHSASSPKIVAGSLRHSGMAGMMCSKGSNVPSPKGSPLRRPGVGANVVSAAAAGDSLDCPGSPMRKISEEQWIDGPRVSRAKVAEARHLLREVNHVKQCETWIDGPKSQSTRSLTAGNLPTAPSQVQGYGFMDSHKKSMIRQWVENQTSQVFQTTSAASSPTHGAGNAAHRDQQAQHLRNITFHMSQLKQKSLDAPEDLYATSTRQLQHQQHAVQHPTLQQQHSLPLEQQQFMLCASEAELAHAIAMGLSTAVSTTNASAPAEIRGSQPAYHQRQSSATGSLGLTQQTTTKDETDLQSTHSHTGYGIISQQLLVGGGNSAATMSEHGVGVGASASGHQSDRQADCDEDQDSGPSEVPPALPLIEPLGSREISHESLHRILSRHVSRESLYQQQQREQQQQELRRQEELQHSAPSRQSSHHYSQHSMGMSDCGLQVTEEEIARTMGGEHPLAALSHVDNMSIVSSFNMAGDAFSDCAMGERTRNQFDQLARLREIFTSQLAMAEVTPVFRSGCDVGSVYSEPAYRFNTGPGSVCSEPPYRPPSPRQPSRSPSQGSLPSLNGIMQIAGMEQYASLRHPDGASDPNLPKVEKPFVLEHEDICEVDEKSALLSPSKRPSLEKEHLPGVGGAAMPATSQTQLPLLPLNTTCEAYDSGHDSSTPRTSKHSGISRRAESGYHSVATARDSDESSFTSGLSKEPHNRITMVKKNKRQDKGLCNWLMNPFTCTYPETEGEISDF
ncbi:PREDICTED: kinesin-like protein CG14535 isoform X2 [Rhagoletis zephyria]|uniref:kinesin-like protein CG14535 isoform X2 n=1 Tax=Rhagoletis zephyria TaxID=28612 RepID=UPI000811858C|nr:PREDICTED: kinesin-like protein CG14535 isoform X2 [Rhagoletis zephyria]